MFGNYIPKVHVQWDCLQLKLNQDRQEASILSLELPLSSNSRLVLEVKVN